MNENVKAKIEALRAEHQEKERQLLKNESEIQESAKLEFNLIKDDFLARVLFDIERFGTAKYRFKNGDFLSQVLTNYTPQPSHKFKLALSVMLDDMLDDEGLTVLDTTSDIFTPSHVIILPRRDTP